MKLVVAMMSLRGWGSPSVRGAWIETMSGSSEALTVTVALRAGGVD